MLVPGVQRKSVVELCNAFTAIEPPHMDTTRAFIRIREPHKKLLRRQTVLTVSIICETKQSEDSFAISKPSAQCAGFEN